MPKPFMIPSRGPLVRFGKSGRGGKQILSDKIDSVTLQAIRTELLRIRGIEEIAKRAAVIQEKAFDWMNQMSRRVDTYERLDGQCGRFNRYIAELLIARDYESLKDVRGIKIAYMELQMAAHHLIKRSEFAAYAEAFRRLSKKTNDGMWTSDRTMPAMPLFQELHGLSPETLKDHHKMQNFRLNLKDNFSPALDAYVKANKRTGTLTELFTIHRDFYQSVMKSKFYEERVLEGIGEGTLKGWFETMIRLAGEVDADMAAGR